MPVRRTRQQNAARAEARELVPAERRRQHLVLLVQEKDMARIAAIVRPADRGALRILVRRIVENLTRRGGNAGYLRLAEAEDGVLNAEDLWLVGGRVDDLAEVA